MVYYFNSQKKVLPLLILFKKIVNEFNRKENKKWVDKESEFYKRSMKSWLQDNDKSIYSTNNEGKSIVTQRFIKTVNNKIYKYMTSI